jgi:SAM-dependent methyltransferase
VSGEQVFFDGEGDAWFARNRARLEAFDPASDLPLSLLRSLGVRPRRVFEIGCANGFRLAALAAEFGCEVAGSDASAAAVVDARQRYGLELLHQDAAEALPQSASDLVILNFVLHWIPRARLAQLVESVTLALEPGGLLLIGDFDPDAEIDVPYHHLPGAGVMTYKRNYPALFEELGRFRTVGFLTADHATLEARAGVPSADRIGIWLLEKR